MQWSLKKHSINVFFFLHDKDPLELYRKVVLEEEQLLNHRDYRLLWKL